LGHFVFEMPLVWNDPWKSKVYRIRKVAGTRRIEIRDLFSWNCQFEWTCPVTAYSIKAIDTVFRKMQKYSHTHTHTHIYIYIHREREREREWIRLFQVSFKEAHLENLSGHNEPNLKILAKCHLSNFMLRKILSNK
jgi:hypothetical protein